MANWYGHSMTRAGQNLIAVLNSRGLPLEISSVKMGSGSLGGRVVSDLQDLIDEELSLDITETPRRSGDGRWNITAIYNNSMIETGFYFREWGVFALDPDAESEILVFYANSGDSADYIPAFDGDGSTTTSYIEERLICACVAGSAGVTAVLSTEQYALYEDLQNHISDTNNPHGVTKEQVGLGNVDNTSDEDKPVSTLQQQAIDACKGKVETVALPAASWVGSGVGPFVQTVTIAGVTANSKVDVQPSAAVYEILLDSGAGFLQIENDGGELTAMVIGGKPAEDMILQVTVGVVT